MAIILVGLKMYESRSLSPDCLLSPEKWEYWSLKIVNPPAGSKQAALGPDVNWPCWADPSNTADKLAVSGWARPGQKFNGLSLKI